MPPGQDGSRRIPQSDPSHDGSSHEETSRVQHLSSVAPPPLASEGEGVESTHDVPTYVPTPSGHQPLLRMLGWVMVIGGALALALVLVVPKLRSTTPATQNTVVAAPPAPPTAPLPAPQAQEAPPAKSEPARLTKKERRAKRAAEAAAAAAAAAASVESKETDIRIRARVAPVRATPDSDGKVLCSVKRGTVMHSVRQTPGSKGRWFGVSCAKDAPGWVHENFVSRP